MKRKLDVLVAGAGIGGLAAAVRLARSGHRVEVVDQAPRPAPVGSGLVMQPVGLAVLRDLGVEEAILRLGAPINRLLGKAAPSGRVVLDARYDGAGEARFGLAVQRDALFTLLYDLARTNGVAIRHNAKVVAADAGAGALRFENGEPLSADLVIDALGAGSALSPDKGRALPYGALWGLLDWPEGAGFDRTVLEQRYRRASQMVGVLPVGRTVGDARDRAAFFWSIRADGFAAWRARPIEEWKAEVRALWPETAPFLDQVTGHRDLTEAHYRHRTLSHPVNRRLVHLGDSWRAASPQLGQGANMALLDAAAIGTALDQAPHLEEALRDYVARRRWHVAIYQTASRLFTPVYQSDSRVLPVVRDHLFAPLSRAWPGRRIVSSLVAGTIGDPLSNVGL